MLHWIISYFYCSCSGWKLLSTFLYIGICWQKTGKRNFQRQHKAILKMFKSKLKGKLNTLTKEEKLLNTFFTYFLWKVTWWVLWPRSVLLISLFSAMYSFICFWMWSSLSCLLPITFIWVFSFFSGGIVLYSKLN